MHHTGCVSASNCLSVQEGNTWRTPPEAYGLQAGEDVLVCWWQWRKDRSNKSLVVVRSKCENLHESKLRPVLHWMPCVLLPFQGTKSNSGFLHQDPLHQISKKKNGLTGLAWFAVNSPDKEHKVWKSAKFQRLHSDQIPSWCTVLHIEQI